MCIIVTGGAGFIGSHLVERLLGDGNEVVVVDSLWTGSSENITRFEANEHFNFIHHDVRNPIPRIDGVTEIYHLACPASPDQFDESPIEIMETCFQGTKNLLDFAFKNGARVLIASTSEIYGDPKVVPQSEKYWGNTNSFGPRSCYDEGKRITEALAYGYQRKKQLEVRIARIFNCFGPCMRINDGRAVPNFIAAAMDGQKIPIYGDGSATRCFQYVSDCVTGLVSLMKSNYSRPLNIGSDIETRVDSIAKMIIEIVALKTKERVRASLEYLPAREDDPYRRKPDVNLAKEELEWSPQVPLRDGLEMTVEWFLQKRQDQASGQQR